MMKQIDDCQDGLVVVQGCHQAMAVKLTGDLPIPLGKVTCKSGDLLAARIIYYNVLVLTTPKHPKTSSSHMFVRQESLI
jgi:hypothetical protein